MVGRTKKPSSTPTPTSTAPVTGQRVKRRTPLKPTNDSKRPTAAKPKKAVKPGTTAKPKKTVKPGASTKPRTIPPATRAAHRPPASTAKKSATFTLAARAGWDVAIAGTFNNWQPQAMTKDSDGLWRISLPLPPGTYQYKFLVDSQWREDPNNPRRTPNDQGGFNSICDVL